MVNLAFIDGGGPVAQPRNQPQTHSVAPGETLNGIADRFGVTPQAIRAANPEIFQDPSARRRDNAQNGGELVMYGDTLNIPAAAQSVVADDPQSSDFNPTYPSPNSEYSVGGDGQNTGARITWNPGDGSVKLSVAQQRSAGYDHTPTPFGIPNANAPGVTFEAKVRGEVAETKGAVNKDGNTEITVEWDTSVVASVSAEAKGKGVNQAELEASAGGGFRSRYKVTLPGENRKPEEAQRINPYDPTSIPVGATVTMDSQTYTQTGLSGSFRHIGIETNVKDASGTSYSVTRVDDKNIRVTMGPNEAVEAFNGVGVVSDVATAMLGRQDNLGESTVRTAQFDLSNPSGQAAYSHFVATGEVAHETPGVSNVATIERIDYSSQTRLKLGLGPEALNVQADLAGPQNTGVFVKTTYPDGSYAYTTNLQYSGNVPLKVTQRFDPQGTEVVSERSYEFQVSTDHQVDLSWWDNMWGRSDAEAEASIERSHAELLNWAFTGGNENGPAAPGKKVTITFSESQMSEFVGQTRAAAESNPGTDPLDLLVGGQNGQPVASNFDFAVSMARNLGGDPYGFAERLFTIAQNADGDIRNGTVRIDADVSSK